MNRIPPTLAELTARFLAQPPVDVAVEGEVTPHEVAGGFRATAAELWRETFVALSTTATVSPGDWASFVAADVALGAVPCAAGLFPQRVRNLADVSKLACHAVKPIVGFSTLKTWANKAADGSDANAALVAAGVLASLGDSVAARKSVEQARKLAGETAAYWNQLGAVAWLSGDADAASAAWANAGDDAAAEFNLGLAALVGGKPIEARVAFLKVAGRMPATSGWGHLARLYAALAA